MSILDKIKDKVQSFFTDFARSKLQGYSNVASGVLVTNGVRELDANNFVSAAINVIISIALHYYANKDAKKLVQNTEAKIESRANDKAMDKLENLNTVLETQVPVAILSQTVAAPVSPITPETPIRPSTPGFPNIK